MSPKIVLINLQKQILQQHFLDILIGSANKNFCIPNPMRNGGVGTKQVVVVQI